MLQKTVSSYKVENYVGQRLRVDETGSMYMYTYCSLNTLPNSFDIVTLISLAYHIYCTNSSHSYTCMHNYVATRICV